MYLATGDWSQSSPTPTLPNSSDRSSSNLGASGLSYFYYFLSKFLNCNTNSVYPKQTPHLAASAPDSNLFDNSTFMGHYIFEMTLHRHWCNVVSTLHVRWEPSKQQHTQQAHNIKMTSYQRRCDVITSHRRWYDVILTLCVHWVSFNIKMTQQRRILWRFPYLSSYFFSADCSLSNSFVTGYCWH